MCSDLKHTPHRYQINDQRKYVYRALLPIAANTPKYLNPDQSKNTDLKYLKRPSLPDPYGGCRQREHHKQEDTHKRRHTHGRRSRRAHRLRFVVRFYDGQRIYCMLHYAQFDRDLLQRPPMRLLNESP